jgi:hypothetical protein
MISQTQSIGIDDMSNMTKAFISSGTQAVLELRANLKNEVCIFETSLNQRIAKIMKEKYQNYDVRADPFYYTEVMEIQKRDSTSPAVLKIWQGLSGDVGVVRVGHDPAVLEVKRFSEGRSLDEVVADRDKLQRLHVVANIDGYVGVHVCQDRGKNVRETIKELEIKLGFPVSVGEIQTSKDGSGWEWAFVCAKVTAPPPLRNPIIQNR